jgi:hypothetical protein
LGDERHDECTVQIEQYGAESPTVGHGSVIEFCRRNVGADAWLRRIRPTKHRSNRDPNLPEFRLQGTCDLNVRQRNRLSRAEAII